MKRVPRKQEVHMEWWVSLALIVGGLIFILLLGFPVAFGFLLTDLIFTAYLMGKSGLEVLTVQIYASLASFVLSPAPMFILMGELMFHSNLASDTLDVLDRWLSWIPGRLSVLAAVSGTIFAATSGSSMANTAMLGTVLVPEMKRRGYSTFMSVGPIIGIGGLAMLIPPSALAVIFASVAQISVGRVLIGGVVPGVLLGMIFCVFIILCAVIKPSCAPNFHTEPTPFSMKLYLTLKYLVPVGIIIFSVLGLIFLGVATPTEAAAFGALATLIINILMGRFNWRMLKASMKGSLEVTAMVLMIVAASKTFSTVLAFTNATDSMVALVNGLAISPYAVLVAMQVIVVVLGCLMDPVSIMLITIPIFMPIIAALGFDPIWFAVIMLVNLEMGNMTPPFGMLIFVMQGVTPKDVTYEEIVWATVPYMLFDILVMAMIIVWPQLALWLPRVVGE
jgi:tripartite ATP-independent transporter DctM subunit